MLPYCVRLNCKCANLIRTNPEFKNFIKNNPRLRGADFGSKYCELWQYWKATDSVRKKYEIRLSKKNSMWS